MHHDTREEHHRAERAGRLAAAMTEAIDAFVRLEAAETARAARLAEIGPEPEKRADFTDVFDLVGHVGERAAWLTERDRAERLAGGARHALHEACRSVGDRIAGIAGEGRVTLGATGPDGRRYVFAAGGGDAATISRLEALDRDAD